MAPPLQNIFNILIHPTYFLRTELTEAIRESSKNMNGKILDIGCGQKPYKRFFIHADEYIGIEYDTPKNRLSSKPDVFYDGTILPFPDGHFDSVISTEVLEHVFNPDTFLSEVYRVLKPGGYLLLTTPLMWKEHQQPYDYGRYSSFGLRYTLTQANFRIKKQQKLVTGVRAIIAIWNRYLKECISVKNYYARVALFAVLISPWTIVGIFLSKILPDKDSTYIGNFILATKIKKS